MKKRSNNSFYYGYIYLVTNNITGMKYIGKRNCNKVSKRYFGRGTKIKEAIAKYGKENFSLEVLNWARSFEELNRMEAYYISVYNADKSPSFYNIYPGGIDGQPTEEGRRSIGIHNSRTISEATRQKLREASLGKNNPMYGVIRTEKSKRLISKGVKNKWKDKEYREGQLKRLRESNPMLGKHHSEETKKKMSESCLSSIKVVKIDPQTGKIIEEYPSRTKAYQSTNQSLSKGTFRNYINAGKIFEGFLYKYKEEK